MVKRILVPVDQSQLSLKAADFAFAMAKQLNAQLCILSVMESNMLEANPDAGEFPDSKRLEIKSNFIELVKNLEEKHSNTPEKVFITEGNVADQIIIKATNWKADLIIMGSHGRSGLRHLLMGSTTEAVIKHSEIPVLIVK